MTIKMYSTRLLFVSFAIIATVGLALGDADPSSHSMGWASADAEPTKAKKIHEIMEKACAKTDFKEEQVYKVHGCINRGHHSLVHDCVEKVLGKSATVLDK